MTRCVSQPPKARRREGQKEGKRARNKSARKHPPGGGCWCNTFLPSPAHAVRVGEGGPLAVEEVLPFEDGEDLMEEARQLVEEAAVVDLAAELAVPPVIFSPQVSHLPSLLLSVWVPVAGMGSV